MHLEAKPAIFCFMPEGSPNHVEEASKEDFFSVYGDRS